jgi:hypothetical protein
MDASTGQAPGRIFISYRREETAYPAGWLYDRLADRFGAGQVFKDVDSIRLGDDFVEVITRAVGSCDVLLALIGDQWLTVSDERGRRRLEDPDDFVRLEIEAALTRQVRVIPILIDGARMPHAEDLPDSLAKLVRRQALELSPASFEFDTSRLLKVLDWTLAEVRTAKEGAPERPEQPAQQAPPSTPPATPAPPDSQRRRAPARGWVLAGVGAGVALILLIAALVANSARAPAPTAPADRQDAAAASGGIHADPTPVTNGDGIRLTGLEATSRTDPPAVGDTVTVRYSLTNVGDQPVQLASTFVGARNAADDNKDAEGAGAGRTLAPGETAQTQARVVLDSAGAWQLWPCYELADGRTCPDEWQAFSVVAR